MTRFYTDGKAEFLAASRTELHPCEEPDGWPEFEITLTFYVSTDNPDVAERELQRIWHEMPDAAARVADSRRAALSRWLKRHWWARELHDLLIGWHPRVRYWTEEDD